MRILTVACEAVRTGPKGNCSVDWGEIVGHLGVVDTFTLGHVGAPAVGVFCLYPQNGRKTRGVYPPLTILRLLNSFGASEGHNILQ